MKKQPKKALYLHFAVILFILACDQLSKRWALNSHHAFLTYNSGIIGGSLAGFATTTRVLMILNLSSFVTLGYLFMQFFVLNSKTLLSFALSGFYASILSNSIDRVVEGAVVDFIPIQFSTQTIILNVADLFQQVSFVALLFLVVKERNHLWSDQDKRGKVLLDAKAQFELAGFFSVSVLLSSFGASLASFSFFHAIFSPGASRKYEFILMSLFMAVFAATLVFVLSLIYSRRIIGPYIAIKNYFRQHRENPSREFRLREGDHFKFLEDEINQALKSND